MFPYDRWQPLSVEEVHSLLRAAPFPWALAGGYAIELFLGAPIRSHGDIDVVIFRDDQHRLQQWLGDWRLYAADPPGTLREWRAAECLAAGVYDIWGHRSGARAWQLQIMLLESAGEEWVSGHNPLVRERRSELLAEYGQVPCLRIEVQLLYKARSDREKDRRDFAACLPLLSLAARNWLAGALAILYPEGHSWRALLYAAHEPQAPSTPSTPPRATE